MKKATFWLMAALLCLCLFPAQAQAQTLSVTAYRLDKHTRLGVEDAVFTLCGADGAPIPFTQQCGVWRCGGAVTALPTDSDGRLTLCGLESGAYQLVQQDAPNLYRKLRQPIELSIDGGGALRVAGHTCPEVAILHRSGRQTAAIAVLALCSLLPFAARLGWLWYKNKSLFA